MKNELTMKKGVKKNFGKIRKSVVFKLFVLFVVLSVILVIINQFNQNKIALSPDPNDVYNEQIEILESKVNSIFNVFIVFFISGAIFFLMVILYLWFFSSAFWY